jgi:aspartate/tyrosine/aromatic aminotransferase
VSKSLVSSLCFQIQLVPLYSLALRAELEATGSALKWNHVTEQIGMFCFSGMGGEQVDALRVDHHIYMTRNGRISMAGVTSVGAVQVEGKLTHGARKRLVSTRKRL